MERNIFFDWLLFNFIDWLFYYLSEPPVDVSHLYSLLLSVESKVKVYLLTFSLKDVAVLKHLMA